MLFMLACYKETPLNQINDNAVQHYRINLFIPFDDINILGSIEIEEAVILSRIELFTGLQM